METNTEKRVSKADFHTHAATTFEENKKIIDRAAIRGIGKIATGLQAGAILDHYKELTEYGRRKEVDVIPFTEYYVVLPSYGVADLIGLGFDYNHKAIKNWVTETKNLNIEGAIEGIRQMEKQRFVFDFPDQTHIHQLQQITSGNVVDWKASLARLIVETPQNREKLEQFKEGHKSQWEEAIEKNKGIWQGRNLEAKVAYLLLTRDLPRRRKTAGEFIDAIHRAGGVVVYSPEGKDERGFSWDVLEKLVEYDIDGIMVWHGGEESLLKREDYKDLIRYLRQKNLIALGGTDDNLAITAKDRWEMGMIYLSAQRVKEFESKQAENRDKYGFEEAAA